MLKLVFSTICGAIKDAIESRSRWQKPSQEPGFFHYSRGAMIWKWTWGSACVLTHLPWACVVCGNEQLQEMCQVQGELGFNQALKLEVGSTFAMV